MTTTLENSSIKIKKKKSSFFSMPLFKQSLKSNWVFWLILSLGSAFIFVIVNLVVGTKQLFTSIDMNKVSEYVRDENLQWLQILGLLNTMGFSLTRIQVMSSIDINSIMTDLVYKIAGVLLPMIYVMVVCNKLIASQVSDGSMAYVLSTPTSRRKVVRTQYLFMILSIFAMYIVICIGAMISGAIANVITGAFAKNPTNISLFFLKTGLYNVGSFFAMFGLTGFAFGASGFFNKSSRSLAVGGGVAVVSFICCILGLFGSPVFVGVGIGVEAMKFFDYLSLFTLLDTTSISEFSKAVCGSGEAVFNIDSLRWIYELGILAIIGITFALIGSIRFIKKDLPL